LGVVVGRITEIAAINLMPVPLPWLMAERGCRWVVSDILVYLLAAGDSGGEV
jgi:hypothetical protein